MGTSSKRQVLESGLPLLERPATDEANEEYHRALLASIRDVVLVADVDGTLSYCSPSVEAALGFHPVDLTGTNERELIHEADFVLHDNFVSRLLATDDPQPPIELRLHDAEGEWHWFELTSTKMLDDPIAHGIVTTARNVTARKEAASALIDLSLRDPLTDLPNRISLMDRMAVALAHCERSCDVLALLFCDLDGFKRVNDSLGHNAGDDVLVQIARRLVGAVRSSDTVARTGGDEFVILCEGLREVDDAATIAAKIRDAIEAPFLLEGKNAVLSVSIGIVTVRPDEARLADPMRMLHNADAAMYKAKHDGRARWQFFDDALVDEVTIRLELEDELRTAIEREQFVLHYQPIFDLEKGTVVGSEALLRWQHPTRGVISPSSFLLVAEQTGLIVPIGAWALGAAATQAREWYEQMDWSGWMSVNVSARQVAEPGLAATVQAILAGTRLDPDALWLELNETALLRAGHSATVELSAVQALGVHLGMDDFGTGYSSLSNLQRLPIDFFKIDRSFIASLDRDGGDRVGGNAIVAALTQLGATLGLQTVAEGIETNEEHDLLAAHGCRYGQGFHLARPMPADALTELLSESRVA